MNRSSFYLNQIRAQVKHRNYCRYCVSDIIKHSLLFMNLYSIFYFFEFHYDLDQLIYLTLKLINFLRITCVFKNVYKCYYAFVSRKKSIQNCFIPNRWKVNPIVIFILNNYLWYENSVHFILYHCNTVRPCIMNEEKIMFSSRRRCMLAKTKILMPSRTLFIRKYYYIGQVPYLYYSTHDFLWISSKYFSLHCMIFVYNKMYSLLWSYRFTYLFSGNI